MTSRENENNIIFKRVLSTDLDYVDIMGVSVALLYSKNLFKKNQDISSFLKRVFNIDFLPYVMKSRTLIVARITKELNHKSDKELDDIRQKIIEYFAEEQEKNELEPKKTTKKKNANDKLKMWLEGL
ncbi:hypothetical protein J7E38_13705 [Bacillus sp. ISL-35]|uniref:hypothetical protein n=1 Tax=Bacillus sp. ISL-35 TaxID=2819122 RepID=UPI001BE8D6CF|nr:hypothetical protein [Bacillus sp. ISL-35]MBT2680065.1 hypothetical protein [Bacillus sp. ISL-35]MBT2702958.1 hypothetical protein [Chryseobacterium sp. ISL-80]